MDKGIMNEPYVQKNIDLLDSYSSEEKAKLNQIFSRFDESTKCYKSPNSGLIKKKVSDLISNASILYSNRQAYSNTLDAAIKIYIETAQNFVSSAKAMEVDINANR